MLIESEREFRLTGKETLSQNLMAFYETSPMREGILCWYPFKINAKILDLSNGILTNMLMTKCENVVTIDAEEICSYFEKTAENVCESDADDKDRFDFIIILDPDDFSTERLRNLFLSLKHDGRLLLAYENPFALRYWAGKRDPVTKMPFDSLFGKGSGISKAELVHRLKTAGFEGQKWYYPLTDHRFAREIYSEDYLPNEHLNQRFVPFIENDIGLLFDERRLYKEIIRAGAFEFMCGAYLVEARKSHSDKPCPVDYAAITAYREPSKRFATVVYNTGTVTKTPLHEAGLESIETIKQNHDELARLGVNVLPVSIENGSLVMQRVDLPTLWDYWADKLVSGSFDPDEMLGQFDRIRDAIKLASATGKCYWELVPANCFFDKKNDEMIFFDQEFSWEGVPSDIAFSDVLPSDATHSDTALSDVVSSDAALLDIKPSDDATSDVAPADIAMARAIYSLEYSPIFKAEPRTLKWLETLKQRYKLVDKWNELINYADKSTFAEVFGEGAKPLDEETNIAIKQVAINRSEREVAQRFLHVNDKLSEMGYEKPAIYGFGTRGRALYNALTSAGAKTVRIYDQNQYNDSVKQMMSVLSKTPADVIIVSMADSEKTVIEFRNKLKTPVYSLDELLSM